MGCWLPRCSICPALRWRTSGSSPSAWVCSRPRSRRPSGGSGPNRSRFPKESHRWRAGWPVQWSLPGGARRHRKLRFKLGIIKQFSSLTHGFEDPADGAVTATADDLEAGQILEERQSWQRERKSIIELELHNSNNNKKHTHPPWDRPSRGRRPGGDSACTGTCAGCGPPVDRRSSD